MYKRQKQESVADAFRRIGGLDVPVLDALPSPEVDRYRNKVQFPVCLLYTSIIEGVVAGAVKG